MEKNKSKKESSNQSEEDAFVMGLGNVADTDIGTIFVNPQYRIKRFVSTVTELINLDSFNRDHELKDFAGQLNYDGFKDDINYVLEHQEKVKKKVTDRNGFWYVMELHPYLTEDKVEGVVITFVDVTDLKKTEEQLSEKVEQVKVLQRQIIKNDVSERWEIGQYLHDELAQLLLSAKFMLSHLKGELEKEGNNHAEQMNKLLNILDQGIEGARDLSHEIVPIDVEDEGVSHAFRNLAHQVEEMYGIQCRLDLDDKVEQINNIEIATHLYRIAHEASKNAVIHGESENIIISLYTDAGYLNLNIEDDGKGFSDEEKAQGGMGINIMRHRMELIGGTLEVKNTTDGATSGAKIICRVPLEK